LRGVARIKESPITLKEAPPGEKAKGDCEGSCLHEKEERSARRTNPKDLDAPKPRGGLQRSGEKRRVKRMGSGLQERGKGGHLRS